MSVVHTIVLINNYTELYLLAFSDLLQLNSGRNFSCLCSLQYRKFILYPFILNVSACLLSLRFFTHSCYNYGSVCNNIPSRFLDTRTVANIPTTMYVFDKKKSVLNGLYDIFVPSDVQESSRQSVQCVYYGYPQGSGSMPQCHGSTGHRLSSRSWRTGPHQSGPMVFKATSTAAADTEETSLIQRRQVISPIFMYMWLLCSFSCLLRRDSTFWNVTTMYDEDLPHRTCISADL